MTLTKAELAEIIFDKVGLNKTEAKEMVEAFFEEIRASLEKGESVKLSGFGNFELRSKTERPGRNPKTGEEIPIKARRVVTFHLFLDFYLVFLFLISIQNYQNLIVLRFPTFQGKLVFLQKKPQPFP